VGTGLRLAVVVLTARLNVALGQAHLDIPLSSASAFLTVFAALLINTWDAPMDKEPGWRGFALLGPLECGLSPLVSALMLGVLVSGWHAPILLLEEGGLQTSFQPAPFALHARCLPAMSGPCVALLSAPNVSRWVVPPTWAAATRVRLPAG
jgi:hypothetical protein